MDEYILFLFCCDKQTRNEIISRRKRPEIDWSKIKVEEIISAAEIVMDIS